MKLRFDFETDEAALIKVLALIAFILKVLS